MRVIVVGAGFGGIAAAIELRRHGIDDVTLLEAAPELGGTWHWNTYPGAACDVPSHFYSYSYAQRRDWSRLCSPQTEILDYLRGAADEHGVSGRIVTGTTVTACRWDDAQCRWTVHTRSSVDGATGDGSAGDEARDVRTWTADALVLATGQLNQPALPRLPGLEDFAGHSFHSARWDHDYDLTGKRVAVIGTGASAVQFVPRIAERAAALTVFQRSGNWFLPRDNRAYPAALKAVFRRVPGVQAARRAFLFQYMEALTVAIRHPDTVGRLLALRSARFMRRQLRDPEVRTKVWPDYTFGCKRVLFSSEFLPALQRDNVELVTEPITRMTSEGPEIGGAAAGGDSTSGDGAPGRVFPVDCVIYGTGFRTNDFMFPMEITGTGGRSLRADWAGGAHAHLGMTVPGYPSMFVLYGPNTNTSGGSIIFYLEAQARYLRQVLAGARRAGADAVDVRPEVEAAGDRAVQDRFAGTAWTRCDSWYRDGAGRIIANWPGYMREYAARTRTADPADFRLIHRPTVAAERPAGAGPARS